MAEQRSGDGLPADTIIAMAAAFLLRPDPQVDRARGVLIRYLERVEASRPSEASSDDEWQRGYLEGYRCASALRPETAQAATGPYEPCPGCEVALCCARCGEPVPRRESGFSRDVVVKLEDKIHSQGFELAALRKVVEAARHFAGHYSQAGATLRHALEQLDGEPMAKAQVKP